MARELRGILALAAVLLSAGCATDRTFGTASSVEVTTLDELPAPVGEGGYVIGPEQVIEIAVSEAPTLTGSYLTDANGNVQFPLLGTVAVGGLSPSAASQLIADRLRGRFVLDPQVRVIPKDYASPTISVGGQVTKPGSYPAVGVTTLLRAVNEAGGMTRYAQLDDVLVMRTVQGQKYIGVYNLGAIERGNYPDPRLYANDIVMVGDSPGRRRIEMLLQFLPLLSTSAILIDRVGN
ncbi:polysaccharide biosynthesis/export family protein [Altererythrobacter sp. H2]|uniref:polysaccharide biosynthesis/export family protein n=1 Tax=Altererythrobacter sp. H2 TaxID=3108391 RepID=UPI002B4C0AA6|nr:polysaccharide biosynthesis/export family protein [Altererythrobacter sp. H2]WRK95986.1 polysaccharide biosynthesis/export family protein [Altererythrobacter sp. H2]